MSLAIKFSSIVSEQILKAETQPFNALQYSIIGD